MKKNGFMEKVNRAIKRSEKFYGTINGGDIKNCFTVLHFTHQTKVFWLTIMYEESLGVPFHEGIGFLTCDIKKSLTITKWDSKSLRSGTMYNSLKDIHPNGVDNDPGYLLEVDKLIEKTKFTTADLDLATATDRRKKHRADLIAEMELPRRVYV